MGKGDMTPEIWWVEQYRLASERLGHVRQPGYIPSPRDALRAAARARKPPDALLLKQRQRLDSERRTVSSQIAALEARLVDKRRCLQALTLQARGNAQLLQRRGRQPYVDGLLTELRLASRQDPAAAGRIVEAWQRVHDELRQHVDNLRAAHEPAAD